MARWRLKTMVMGQEIEGSVIRVSVNKDGNAIGLISILGSWLNDVCIGGSPHIMVIRKLGRVL